MLARRGEGTLLAKRLVVTDCKNKLTQLKEMYVKRPDSALSRYVKDVITVYNTVCRIPSSLPNKNELHIRHNQD